MSPDSSSSRAEAIDLITTTLAPRASRLTRLLVRSSGSRQLSRTEVGALLTLLDGPRRITELAATEALAQPTVTQLVDKLEKRGLVARERSGEDRRVVLVAISERGREQLEALRAGAREVMRETLKELSDGELDELVTATEILGRLVETLQAREAEA
jgi:DNA-binding MarR family transcriptional regulator